MQRTMSDCQGGIALCFYFMLECDVQIIKPSNNKAHVITQNDKKEVVF